jgi:hypothetical protein
MPGGYVSGDGRFARAAPAADPVDVWELFPKRRTIGSIVDETDVGRNERARHIFI